MTPKKGVLHLAIPEEIKGILNILERNGQQAYVVGGCVRDGLLGRVPKDWDVATSARPEEVKKFFENAGYPVLETGIQHGTVTVMAQGDPVEVTTFRVDGAYRDHRRPEQVRFTASLKEDVSRRDFTINAMAYHPDSGLMDYFGGERDCRQGVLRCVGDPDSRFQEDALRMMRALRFSSVLGFPLEEETGKAVLRRKEGLRDIAAERISKELIGLLLGENAVPVLRTFYPVIGVWIPELLPLVGLDQKNPHHIYDAWEHTLHSLLHVPPVPALRLAMLFHDIAKPRCFSLDEKGIGHFYSHASLGKDMACAIMKRLRMDNTTGERVALLIQYHDADIEPSPKMARRWLSRLSPEVFFQLLQVKEADCLAQSPDGGNRLRALHQLRSIARRIVEEGQCLSLKELAVHGKDLQEIGILPGKKMGETLRWLLHQVMEEALPNEREALLEACLQRGKDTAVQGKFAGEKSKQGYKRKG